MGVFTAHRFPELEFSLVQCMCCKQVFTLLYEFVQILVPGTRNWPRMLLIMLEWLAALFTILIFQTYLVTKSQSL